MSVEDKEKSNSSSHDEVNVNGVAIRDPVSGSAEGTLADKSSSMKTVALWVCILYSVYLHAKA